MPAAWASAQTTTLIDWAGDQYAPALSGSHVAFLEPDGGASSALSLVDLSDPASPKRVSLESSGVVAEPRAAGGLVAYRRSGEVRTYSISTGATRRIVAPGAGPVAISSAISAWVQDAGGGANVAWMGIRGAAPVVVNRGGLQHSPAVSQGWLAYIDESDGGSVHLIDTTAVVTDEAAAAAAGGLPVYPGLRGGRGEALEVAIWTDGVARRVVAVLVAGASGAEIVFIDPSKSVPSAADPSIPDLSTSELKRLVPGGGVQHLRMVGDWIAYEDLSAGPAWVTLREWVADRTFHPTVSLGAQTLGDLEASDKEIRAAWSQLGATDLDVMQLRVGLPLEGAPGPVDGAVTCGAPGSSPIVDFTVKADDSDVAIVREYDDRDGKAPAGVLNDHGADGWHVKGTGAHDESWHGDRRWRDFELRSFDADQPRRVVVCIDAVDVASAWVGVGSEVVAAPADFSMGTLSLEARVTVPAKQGNAGAVVIAKRSGSLRVRVLDDPGGDVNGVREGSTCSARGDCPPPPGGILSKLGCGSSGGAATLASLLIVVLLVARPSRRRSRS